MKNIRIFLSFVMFIIILCAAAVLAPRLGEKLDMPFEAGLLQAPAIQHHGEGHAPEAGHGEQAPEGHGEPAPEGHGEPAPAHG